MNEARKYRLRLLFQEIDLPPGLFSIGRATNCTITIDDPLVSRRHAEIAVSEDNVLLRDLDSRNGTRVNGKQVEGEQPLRHGDRIRIGGYEFVFIVDLEQLGDLSTQTMQTVRCSGCGNIYPEHMSACPACGLERSEQDAAAGPKPVPDESTAPISVDELDNLSDSMLSHSTRMIDEVIQMALSMERFEKAADFIDRKVASLERRLSGGTVRAADLVRVSEFNLAAARGLRQGERIGWVLDTWTEQGLAMPDELCSRIEEAASGWYDLGPAVSRYLTMFESDQKLAETRPRLVERLRAMR
ncbi:MAG: FHA domain-containing protein [Polyangia bacterium]